MMLWKNSEYEPGASLFMTEYYTAIILVTIFSLLVMVAAAYRNSFLPKEQKHGFIAVFFCIVLTASAEWFGVFLDGAPRSLRFLHTAAKVLEFSLTPAIPVICAWAVGPHKSIRWMAIPLLANAVLELLSAHYGFIFYVDADNFYHRCAWYGLYVAAFLLGIGYLFFRSFHLSRRFQNRNSMVLGLILSFLTLGTGTQIVNRSIRIDWICVALSTMLFYIYYSDLIQQLDALTGLLNRRSYDCSAEGIRRPAVILFFDVDGFKSVNDRYGHQCGDQCLSRVGAQLKATYGKHGLCYRFGGDEFCVILSRQPDSLEKLNASFLHGMERQRADEPRLPWVSVGYALFDPAQERVEDAMRRADEMMYRYKQRSREASAVSQDAAPEVRPDP